MTRMPARVRGVGQPGQRRVAAEQRVHRVEARGVVAVVGAGREERGQVDDVAPRAWMWSRRPVMPSRSPPYSCGVTPGRGRDRVVPAARDRPVRAAGPSASRPSGRTGRGRSGRRTASRAQAGGAGADSRKSSASVTSWWCDAGAAEPPVRRRPPEQEPVGGDGVVARDVGPPPRLVAAALGGRLAERRGSASSGCAYVTPVTSRPGTRRQAPSRRAWPWAEQRGRRGACRAEPVGWWSALHRPAVRPPTM